MFDGLWKWFPSRGDKANAENVAEKGLPSAKPDTPSSPAHHLSPSSEDDEVIPEYDLRHELSKHPPELQHKIKTWKDRIQPHTDEGGDAYYIGDAYGPINPTCAEDWAIPKPGRYLQFLKALSPTWPHLEYLAHWMEVTCAPPKWKFVKDHPASRDERAKRTKACIIDYKQLGSEIKAISALHNEIEGFRTALDTPVQDSQSLKARLIIVEDLSRDVVETLGSKFDIDPLFFLSHIGDYLFHNTRDRWVELPNLDVDTRKRHHFNLQFLRPRYFKTETEFSDAEYQSGGFNVLRRLDSDRSRKRLQNGLLDVPGGSVTLTRAKTSVWIKPREANEPVTAILLVDPTVKPGSPLWNGYRPFHETPSMQDWQQNKDQTFTAPPGGSESLFDHVVYWSKQMTADDLTRIEQDPKCIAFPMFRLVIADWLAVLKYMTTMLGIIEWGFEKPHWSENPDDIDMLLKKLSPWRRNIGYYQTMISDAIARLFPPALKSQLDSLQNTAPPQLTNPPAPSFDEKGILALWTDFKNIKQMMNDSQARISSIQTMATNAINTEEARRAVRQNKNLARLTFLATIFIPLNFTTSFLSMSPDFPSANYTIWLFFALGVPIMLSALIAIDLTHPEKNKSKVRTVWRKLRADMRKNKAKSHDHPDQTQPQPYQRHQQQQQQLELEQPERRPDLGTRKKTIPWLRTSETSYMKSR